jgi:hypothetical protein
VVENVTYTRDGSYLRLKNYGSYWELEFPNGNVHRFGTDGRILQLRDPFGNQLDVGYPALAGAGMHSPLLDMVESSARLAPGEAEPSAAA